MRSAASPRYVAGVAAALLVAALCWPAGASALPAQESPDAALQKMRSSAEAQHEIVVLLIQKKDFDKAIAEAAKIFAMRWPVDQEPVLLKELLFLSDKFAHGGQTRAALQLLDDNTKAFRTAQSRVAIWKEKGYLYKVLKDNDKALDCFREARRLESPQ
jgi:tetratricopeptide (TPR) repeat protein